MIITNLRQKVDLPVAATHPSLPPSPPSDGRSETLNDGGPRSRSAAAGGAVGAAIGIIGHCHRGAAAADAKKMNEWS